MLCYRRPNLTKLFSFIVLVLVQSPFLPILANAQITFEWTREFGTNSDDQVNAVAASASGVYAGGNTIGVFPGQSSAGLNDVDAFVARYDTAGNQIWVRQFGSTTVAEDSVQGVAADSTGVYAVGWTNGTLPGQGSSGSTDVFVRKYDVNGTELWTKQFGTPSLDQALAVAVDASGLYVVGFVSGPLPGQPGFLANVDAFVRKYDAGGNELWTRQFGTVDGEEARGVAVHASGVYVSGYSGGALAPPSQGGSDVFLRKYDASGTVVWTRQFGTATTDVLYGNAVAVNASGVYVSGETAGTFAGQTNAGGLFDAFAARFDLAGNQQWVRQFGTTGDDYAFGVAVNATGAYFVGANCCEALPGTTALGGSDAWVRVYDASANEISTQQFGTNSNDEALGVAADGTGVYIGGYFGSGSDGFVAKIPPPPSVYYLPHLALGAGWQTTLTYLNYSASPVTCQTTFLNDAGAPLAVPFGGPADSTRTDVLAALGSLHIESTADLNAPVQAGWARVSCNGAIKPSILFRFYSQGVPTGEASVSASVVPATKFVTFAERLTGVAYANPSSQTATITVTVFNTAGQTIGSANVVLPPGAHSAANLNNLIGITDFVGSAQIVSTVPIVALSLNFEVFPVFSSLPPGEFDDTGPPTAQTYYLPHLALGAGWQTTLTFLNYSASPVTCTSTFLSDSGAALPVPFGAAAASSRTDVLPARGSIHVESTAILSAPVQAGWSRVQCSAPVKPSILFRFYSQGVPTGEASVNASLVPARRFVTFAERLTGVAYANPSLQTATVTVTVYNTAGQTIGSANVVLPPGAHGAANLNNLIGITNFVGSAQVVSSIPIVVLSLNFEAFPVFSSLPPGDLPD